MTVQSARVQEIVIGDDVVLTHQIMKDVAFNAELSRAPDPLSSGDQVNFFYPLANLTLQDLVGYPGVPVGSYPTSSFTVAIPGTEPGSSAQGTNFFQPGLAQTVRAEIRRLKASFTGDVLTGSSTILNASSTTGLAIGQSIQGAGIPAGSLISAISGSTIAFSGVATATATSVSLTAGSKETQYLLAEVDILARGFPTQPDNLDLP